MTQSLGKTKLRIGTDCSGIEAPIQALKKMKVDFSHEFSSEIDENCIKSIYANYNPKILYRNMIQRNNKELPDIDIYVCGFPCQPYSNDGLKKGLKDERSSPMLVCIDVINQKLPKIFILENVAAFKTTNNGEAFKYLLKELEKKRKYNIYIEILNACDYGLPQNRKRIFIIGIRKDVQTGIFETPERKKMCPLDEMLVDHTIYDEPMIQTMRKNFERIKNYDPDKNYVVTNCGFPGASGMEEKCPTLKTSCNYYLTKYGRRLFPIEALKLQGFDKSFKQVVSDTQMYKQAGNSMAVDVLVEIFREIFRITDF